MAEHNNLIFEPIGVVQSPYVEIEGMSIQPTGAEGIRGQVIIDPDLVEGLIDLDGFSHLILIYVFHKTIGFNLKVKPFLDTETHGVFATRAPRRPNPIGLSTVRLLEIHDNILEIECLDILDGTPVLDIKPYIQDVCQEDTLQFGWLEDNLQKMKERRSDDRFIRG
jgi:tRNA-Thr(GGU) m(6)t(6)A37 methyltransferase TsaA